ncbi:MAG: hypothetical protein IPL65_05265 [Lewinellaceae bacterium]|nr:hypothetical protein [Lewinellaceae bacterium]
MTKRKTRSVNLKTMGRQAVLLIIIGLAVYACQHETQSNGSKPIASNWNVSALKDRAMANLDSSQWNQTLFKQDIETHFKYSAEFEAFPLNNYPFPVADYDYAVYSNPFTIKTDSLIFKGIQVGAYENPESDRIITKLALLVLTNDDKVTPESFVDSRNFPYLTAEGNFRLSKQNFEWVFQATPDGFSSLFFSMKLFDLRFGQTIIIYPQKDNSFLYKQIEESPNNYSKFEDYTNKIKENHITGHWEKKQKQPNKY